MMNFGQFNIGYMNLPANVFSFMPMQNTSASSMGNIFGIGVVQQPSYNFSMSPLSSDSFYNYWNNNQAQLQQLMLEALIQIMSNPLINHTPTENIQNNFRPYDYNQYNLPDYSPTFDFTMPVIPGNISNTGNSDSIDDVSKKSGVSQSTSKESPYNTTSSDVNAYGSNAKKISQLNPEMQEKTMQLLDYAKEKGLKVQITSGYRTQEEQQELLRTRPQFAAKRSAHCEGKAIDIKIIGGSDADYKMLGDYAKSIGMRWGGDFSKVKERWHFDYQWG